MKVCVCVCAQIYENRKNIIPEVWNQKEELQWDIAERLK